MKTFLKLFTLVGALLLNIDANAAGAGGLSALVAEKSDHGKWHIQLQVPGKYGSMTLPEKLVDAHEIDSATKLQNVMKSRLQDYIAHERGHDDYANLTVSSADEIRHYLVEEKLLTDENYRAALAAMTYPSSYGYISLQCTK